MLKCGVCLGIKAICGGIGTRDPGQGYSKMHLPGRASHTLEERESLSRLCPQSTRSWMRAPTPEVMPQLRVMHIIPRHRSIQYIQETQQDRATLNNTHDDIP